MNKIAVIIEDGMVVNTIQPKGTKVYIFDKDTYDNDKKAEIQTFHENELSKEDATRLVNVLEKKHSG